MHANNDNGGVWEGLFYGHETILCKTDVKIDEFPSGIAGATIRLLAQCEW